MISRQVSDGRFTTQWGLPRYGEPSDHGASFAFLATTGGSAPAAMYLSFAPTNSPIGLGARIFIRVTAPARAYLQRGVPGWPSAVNTVWKPTNPIIQTNQTIPTLSINTRQAYNSITGAVYTSQQMGDPSITCQLGYVGGVTTAMNVASNPQQYNPIVSQQVVVPPTVVATEYWNDATAAITSVCTTLQIAISAHGFVSLPIVLDEDITYPSNTIVLIEGYIDGDVRQTAFSSTSNYTVWNGNNINAAPVAQTPQLVNYPTFAAGGMLGSPTTALLTATKTKIVPLEMMTCANGFEYSGVLDGYQLYMPSSAEAGVPTAGRTAWQFVKRGGGDLTGGISAWAMTVSSWHNANRVIPIATPSVTTTTGTETTTASSVFPVTVTSVTGSSTESASSSVSTLPAYTEVTTSLTAVAPATGTIAVPALTTTTTSPAVGSAISLTETTPVVTVPTTSTTTVSTSSSTLEVAPAVTDSQFSFRLNFASLFNVEADLQAVNAATGAVTATYACERTLLSFNAAPAGNNRLILQITNVDGTNTVIDMDTPGLQSGMTVMRRQKGIASRSSRGISSPIGKGAV